MSTNAQRAISITFTGDVAFAINPTAAVNATSPGTEQLLSLASGDNILTVPTTGARATSLTIIKPAGNTVALKLKGVGGDTGITLHLTDPDSISLDPGQASVILNAAAICNGVRLVWA